MIKAVIFDIDGVLLDSFEANLRFYQDLMVAAGYPPPRREEFPPLFHLSMRDAIKTLTKSNSNEEITRIWEMGKGRAVPYHVELLTMPQNAEQTIQTLNRTYRLGIVTSRIQNSVYEAPGLAKLKKYFQVAVAYEDTTNHKPHPEPLLLAAKALYVLPNEAVYIGDVENDIIAGHAAGMKVIIYAKANIPSADAWTQNFLDLPQLISIL